jgi:NAD(P)H-quinone oxidoreductase subunit 5
VHVADAPALYAVAAILALALAPLLAGPIRRAGGLWTLAGVGGAFAVAVAYFGLHRAFEDAVGSPVATSPALVAWVVGAFVVLFIVQGAVRANPVGPLARSLYPTLFAGLYLDELFTRLTFRLWPARLPARADAPSPALPERPLGAP